MRFFGTVTVTRLNLCVKSVGGIINNIIIIIFFNNLCNLLPSSGGPNTDFGGCEKGCWGWDPLSR